MEGRNPIGATDTRKSRVLGLTLLSCFTLAGLGLRFYGSDSGLWTDEITSLLDSFRRPFHELIRTFPGDNQHPLYSILARVSMLALGESAWTIRLPAALFGAASIPLVYWLGRETVGRAEALAGSALMTVSYHHVWFSQNARGYSALGFFAIMATCLLVRGLRTGRRGFFVAYAVAVGIGSYMHLSMVFLALGQAAVVVWLIVKPSNEWRADRVSFLTAFGAGAALTLLLYSPMLSGVLDYFGRPTDMVKVSTPGWAAAETLRALKVGWGAGVVVVAVLALAAAGVWRLCRASPVILALFLAPGAGMVAGAALARGTMYPRFFFFMAGFAVLIMAAGAFWSGSAASVAIGHPAKGRKFGTAICAILIAASAVSLRSNYRNPKQDFSGARAFVEEHRGPQEKVMTIGVTIRPYREYFGLDWPAVRTAADVNANREQAPAWLVYSFPRYVRASYPDVWTLVETDCESQTRFRGTLGDGDILVCRFPKMMAENRGGPNP